MLMIMCRVGSDAERDLTVSEQDGAIRAASRIDREALEPTAAAQYRFEVARYQPDEFYSIHP